MEVCPLQCQYKQAQPLKPIGVLDIISGAGVQVDFGLLWHLLAKQAPKAAR